MNAIESEQMWHSQLTKPAPVLLVDDDLDDVELFRHNLAGFNIELSICTNGDEAVDFFFRRKYAAVFLDLKLPGRSGSEVFKVVRIRDRETPIAILSGYIDETIERDLPQYGRVTFMKKSQADISAFLRFCGIHQLASAHPFNRA